jgi:hypothetical protein
MKRAQEHLTMARYCRGETVSSFFREDLVKVYEPGLSLVCYHSRRRWGQAFHFPFSLVMRE